MVNAAFQAPQLARMLLILEWLRDSRRFNSKDVVEHFMGEVSERTIKNDIENLRSFGYAVEYNYHRKSYVLTDASSELPVPQIRRSELATLQIAQQVLETMGVGPLADTADKLINRIRELIPDLTGIDFSSVSPSLTVIQGPHAEVSFPHWKELSQAVRETRSVEIDYFTMYRDKTSTRTVDPYRLVSREGRSYMIAWCHINSDIRIFRLDRVRRLELTDEFFVVRPEFDEDEFIGPMFGIFNDGKPFKVKVRFSPWVARWIREDRWHKSQVFTDLQDGSLQVDMEVTGTVDVKRWILSFGRDAEVLEPEHLRRAVTYDVEVMGKVYGGK